MKLEDIPPPGRKFYECSTLKELRESIIDDIRYYRTKTLPGNDYISHMIYMNTSFLERYLKDKFDIDENNILGKGKEEIL